MVKKRPASFGGGSLISLVNIYSPPPELPRIIMTTTTARLSAEIILFTRFVDMQNWVHIKLTKISFTQQHFCLII